jgi:AcrR family transcriptional regulator
MRPRQFTDEELYDVTRRCILEHGPAVSIGTIAAALNVSSAALFHRFGSKAQLLRHALRIDIDDELGWVRRVEEGPDARPVAEQLAEIAHAMDDFFRRMMPTFLMLRASGLCPRDLFDPDTPAPPIRAIRALTNWIARLHEQARVHAPQPQAIALAFFGGLQSRHAMRHAIGEHYPDGGPHYIDTFVSVFSAGLRVEKGRADR